MTTNYTRSTCRLCGGDKLTKVLELGPTPIGDEYVCEENRHILQPLYPLDVWLCQNCGLLQLLDIVTPESIYNNYIYLTRTSPGLAAHFQDYATDIAHRGLPSGALAVDVGSNDGTFLQALKNYNFHILGVEPAEHIAKLATDEGIPTISAYFGEEIAEKIRAEYGPAHFISTNNILANVDQLDDMINGIYTLLAEDGFYALECSYLGDLIDNFVFDSMYHEHLSYFSLHPLQLFFERHDMELFDVIRTSSKGGSIRVFIQKRGGPRPISHRLTTLAEWETKRKLYDLTTFEKFRYHINIAAQACHSLLQKCKDDGKIIACYGASPTTATLLYHFRIQNFFDFYVDENPIKIGRFSPGTHLKVCGPESLTEYNPSFAFIAAWRFSNAIINRHTNYLKQGGTFIIPLPSIHFACKYNDK